MYWYVTPTPQATNARRTATARNKHPGGMLWTANRIQRRVTMASIWTEARWNIAPDSTTADGTKCQFQHFEGTAHIGPESLSLTSWDTHPGEVGSEVEVGLFTGQRVQPSTRTLIQQLSRLWSADPFQQPGVVQWQPILPRRLSKVRYVELQKAHPRPKPPTPEWGITHCESIASARGSPTTRTPATPSRMTKGQAANARNHASPWQWQSQNISIGHGSTGRYNPGTDGDAPWSEADPAGWSE